MHDVFLVKELPGAITCILPDKTKLSLDLQDCFMALRVKVHVLFFDLMYIRISREKSAQ